MRVELRKVGEQQFFSDAQESISIDFPVQRFIHRLDRDELEVARSNGKSLLGVVSPPINYPGEPAFVFIRKGEKMYTDYRACLLGNRVLALIENGEKDDYVSWFIEE